MYLKGGFDSVTSRPVNTSNLNRTSSVKHISRHAVALLLGRRDMLPMIESTVLDLRRVDELVMFGSIQGTKHLVGAYGSLWRRDEIEVDTWMGV